MAVTAPYLYPLGMRDPGVVRPSPGRRAEWILGAALLGVILGWLGARVVFVNSALSLVPWGLGALAFGAAIRWRVLALAAAAVFGFTVSLGFLLFGYEGTYSTLSRIAPFSILGLFGAFCAACLALAAHIVVYRRSTRRGSET